MDGLFDTRYDGAIQYWVNQYLPDSVDWRLYKAQLYQESLFDPKAVSHAGACGLAQFMPATWQELCHTLSYPVDASPFDPDLSIRAGAWYMAKMRAIWRAPRPEFDRHSLALASYNAGGGNLIAAQKCCGGKTDYKEIVACLGNVTGQHATETSGYVQRVWQHTVRLLTGI